MKKLILVLMVLSLVAFNCCVSDNKIDKFDKNEINYFTDKRTGICFAEIKSRTYAGFYVVSITAVDCEKVKKYLGK